MITRFLIPVVFTLGLVTVSPAKERVAGISADAALARLKAGNARFVAGKVTHPNQGTARRTELSKGQHPFAVIVGCSDSRTAPEVLFDQGLGDLFVIRLAGNVVDDMALGSIEYAAEHLGTSLVVVLGHEKCGAVKATLEGGKLPGHVPAIAKKIRPAVKAVAGHPGDALDNAVRENARLEAKRIADSKPILRRMVQEGRIRVVAARYDLDSGRITILE